MRRLSFQWQLVAPRLLAVIVVILAAQYLLGLVARRIVARSGEAVLAVKVEAEAARLSLLDRQVLLGNVRIAHPCRPNEKLLEADRCELDFSIPPLLRKQAVIESGRITGLRFVAKASETTTDCTEPQSSPTHNWLTNDCDQSAREWLANLNQKFEQLSVEQFESLQRSEALFARWPGERAALNERADQLIRRAAELHQATDAAEANRIRHAQFFGALPAELAGLEREFDQFGVETEKLSAAWEAERRAIVAARQRDERTLRERLALEPIDADSLTAYLLREQLAGPLDELIDWLRLARHAVPAGPKAQPRHQRGEDILFTGCGPAPNVLLREMQLQGTARLGEQSVELRGMLTDVSDMPSRHGAPMRLRLTSAGSVPVEVRATIERTGAAARDELLIDCRGVALPKLRLGRPDEFEMTLTTSIGSLSISVAVEGEKLSGDIQLVQKQVGITPFFHGELAEVPLAAPLQATLGNVNSVATRLTLEGTLDEPSCTLWSNLGPAVAEALERAWQRTGDEQAQALLVNARRAVDEQLADRERQLAAERTKLAAQLTSALRQVENIASRQTPPERISVDQLGRRLPENSLFR